MTNYLYSSSTMATYVMHLQEEYFQMFLDGRKSFEGRSVNSKTLAIKCGDFITFYTPDDSRSFTRRVLSIHRFPSIKSACQAMGCLLIPGASEDEAEAVYTKLYKNGGPMLIFSFFEEGE